MRSLLLLLVALASNTIAQSVPQPLWVTNVYDITSANQVQDNRSNTRQCNMFTYRVTSGTGNWAAQLEYSESASGPWTAFSGSSGAGITYSSPDAIGYAYGYHPFVRVNTTAGTTAVDLSCEKDFYFPTGNGITQLSGDATAGPGNGAQTITLNTVNSNPGTFGDSSSVPVLTVNGKGLVTGVSTATIPPSGITQLTGDVTTPSGSGSQAATLATVNANPGTFGSSTEASVITVNGKGLVTSVTTAPIAAGSGTVTSLTSGNLSPLFTVSVANPTTTPALTFSLSSAAANSVFAGPNGAAGSPAFRALVGADIPAINPGSTGNGGFTALPTFTAGSNVTITGAWPNLTISATNSGSGWTIGPLSGLPPTPCAVGAAYFATDQPANQQLYTCSAANVWTQNMLLGPSGALAVTNGALDITSTVPQKGNPNEWTALNTFDPGYVLKEQASGSKPASGFDMLYVNSGDHALHMVNSAGTDTAIGSGGGFTGTAKSIPFVGSGGSLTEDNTALQWQELNANADGNLNVVGQVTVNSDSNANGTVEIKSGGVGPGLSGVLLRNDSNNTSWWLDLSGYSDWFDIDESSPGNAVFAISKTSNNVYLGGSFNAASAPRGAGAIVTIMTSENGHIYTHGSAPTISACTGTNAVCMFGSIKKQTTATITSGSADVTVASATGLAVGDMIMPLDFPSGTTISAINGTTITMSVAATTSGTSAPFITVNTIADNDDEGAIVLYSGSAATVGLTFNAAWTSIPIPSVTTDTGAVSLTVSPSTTEAVFAANTTGAMTIFYSFRGTN